MITGWFITKHCGKIGIFKVSRTKIQQLHPPILKKGHYIFVLSDTHRTPRHKKSPGGKTSGASVCNGGRHRARTCDLFRVKEALFR